MKQFKRRLEYPDEEHNLLEYIPRCGVPMYGQLSTRFFKVGWFLCKLFRVHTIPVIPHGVMAAAVRR